ncbi:MAG: DUF1015 domain-containing protein [Desulfarculus sp.]|nr:DUF1015 domain-containing protein [Desulfarculus sp.]
MAVIAPFKALRYDQDKIPSLNKVVTPPYDVINARQQDEFYQSHPHNIIRVELNKPAEVETVEDNIYTRAGAHLRDWMAKGILARDPKPALYLSETTYVDSDGQTRVRKGFFTALKVEDYSSGVILPHEKTFTGHKEDRFKLTKATGANVSPIFALYPDGENEVHTLLEQARRPLALADFVDPMGLPQRLYAVDDPEACRQAQRLMADKKIFIADGHHRYETGLNYRNHLRGLYPGRGDKATFNYVLTYLCSMSDPGLTVFPCHRVVPYREGFDAKDFLVMARRYFNVEEIPYGDDQAKARQRLADSLAKAGLKRPSFGMASMDSQSFYVLSLKVGVRRTGPMQATEPALKDLDVMVLNDVVLDHILGLDNNATDQLHTIKYLSRLDEVVDEVQAGQSRLAFLMNPTKVSQVEAVAQQGLVMPRKSTYFYPKVLTGLVLHLIVPEEDAAGCQD